MQEEIKKFINYKQDKPRVELRGFLIAILLISIPTALFGIGKTITTFIIIPIMIVFVFWTIYLFFHTDKKMKNFYLYLGLSSIYITFVLLLSIYKLLSTIIMVPLIILFTVYLIYALVTLINILIFKILIKKGFYLNKHKSTALIVIIPFSILGIIIERIAAHYLSQIINTIIVCIIMFFIALIFSVGSVNILKYVYIRQLEKETQK